MTGLRGLLAFAATPAPRAWPHVAFPACMEPGWGVSGVRGGGGAGQTRA